MEEVVAAHPQVAECAVVGVNSELKGQVPLAMVVVGLSARNFLEIANEIISSIRTEIGPVAALKTVIQVKRLPKTRSGKILRKLIRAIANEEEFTIPSTIDDPAIVEEIKEAIHPNYKHIN
jgi:propionyl-CoA synthetase